MKKVFLVLAVLGCAGFTACSSTPRATESSAPKVSDHDSALTELANGAVDVCLGNTVYITNKHASVLAPKLQAGKPVLCGVQVAEATPVVLAKKAKRVKK